MPKQQSKRVIDRIAKDPPSDFVELVKAQFLGEDSGSQSNAMHDQEMQYGIFNAAGAIPPPYDHNVLALVFENSSNLRPNVDAYITNIDSFGHIFEPVIDVEADGAKDKVKDALRVEGAIAKRFAKSKKDLLADDEPSASDVTARLKQLKIDLRTERAILENFFENCTPDMPFSGPEGLRGLTRQDVETFGNGYWEILRNGLGEIAQFNYMPAKNLRLTALASVEVDVEIDVRESLLSSTTRKAKKRFRRYVQIAETNNKVVFFKEYGDPRALDAKTGKFFPDVATAVAYLKDQHRRFIPATELLAFKVSSTRTPYGVPRWIGALLAVLGTRQSEEVNFLYFENRSVPPLAVLVSGGRLNSDSVSRLEDYVATQIRGKRNSHKILILEAESADSGGDPNTGRMKIVLQPLTDAQQKDGQFQTYEDKNADKVGQAFRMPRLLRGDVRDFNRNTADAAIDFAEIQVFGPIRQQFDWIMNKQILPKIGIKYHRFKSNAPTVRDPQALSTMVKDMVTGNVLTPGEGRELAALIFNRDFDKIKEVWANQPIGITLAGRTANDDTDPFSANGGMAAPGAGPSQEALGVDQSKPGNLPTKGGSVKKTASILQRVHAEILKEEQAMFADMKAETIKVPADLFYSFFAKSTPSAP